MSNNEGFERKGNSSVKYFQTCSPCPVLLFPHSTPTWNIFTFILVSFSLQSKWELRWSGCCFDAPARPLLHRAPSVTVGRASAGSSEKPWNDLGFLDVLSNFWGLPSRKNKDCHSDPNPLNLSARVNPLSLVSESQRAAP